MIDMAGVGSIVAIVLGSAGGGAVIVEMIKSWTRGGDRRQEQMEKREASLNEATDRVTSLFQADNARLREDIGRLNGHVARIEAAQRLATDQLAVSVGFNREARPFVPEGHDLGRRMDRFLGTLLPPTPPDMEAQLRKLDGGDK